MSRSQARSTSSQVGSPGDPTETLSPALLPELLEGEGSAPAPGDSAASTGHAHFLPSPPVLGVIAALALLATAGIVLWEMHTSTFQARWFSNYAQKLTWDVKNGPCERSLPPPRGPYDERLGYATVQRLQQKLTARDFQVARQACPSPELVKLAQRGIAPPYDEKHAGTLQILDREGKDLYRAPLDEFAFGDLSEIPDLVVQSLLFVENRQLFSSDQTTRNPAVEWDRLFFAGTNYALEKVTRAGGVQGGSTLATQIEKFRHSPNGRTTSGADKMRQIFGASLRAYRRGPDTRGARREIVLDYVNSMPLGAATGVGEVTGLGQGMWSWFGKRPRDLRLDLTLPEEDRNLRRKAETYKQVLALIMATRRPTLYLGRNHEQLEMRIASYLPLLAEAGIVTPRLAAATIQAPLHFNDEPPQRKRVTFVDRKATNGVRAELLDLLEVSNLYTLDRYDLRVETSIDAGVQEKVTSVLRKLTDPRTAADMGLYGSHLLAWGNDPSKVVYSFSLYETSREGNRLRVSVDTYDNPLDVNANVKLELGSTAKLRTMANYLMVIADLHETFHRSPPEQLAGAERAAVDPITRWATSWLRYHPEASLEETLDASLLRFFSTDTHEGFFTGGGLHYFKNFEESIPAYVTLRNGFQHSINLVYIRLMRELEQYYMAGLDYDQRAILADPGNPKRQELLDSAMENEARETLRHVYRRYDGLSFEAALANLCGKDARGLRRLAIFAMSENTGASFADVRDLAHRVYPGTTAGQDSLLHTYQRMYANRIHSAQDEAYLLGRQELECWLVRDRRDHPDTAWPDVLGRSTDARRASTRWIYPARFREAQNLRIRIELERRAFVQIHRAWRELGYPFDSLVPSLATAIGSSADRPQALAELVGIIQQGGKRVPLLRVEALHFGEDTPYETHFEPAKGSSQVAMPPEVAAALKQLMLDVVNGGTARRAFGSLRAPDGEPIPLGGKTGSGDNRYQTFAPSGAVISSRAINRTASFVFVIGDRFFGMISAYVDGEDAGRYSFTSSLALQAFRHVAEAIEPLVQNGEGVARADAAQPSVPMWPAATAAGGAPAVAPVIAPATAVAAVPAPDAAQVAPRRAARRIARTDAGRRAAALISALTGPH